MDSFRGTMPTRLASAGKKEKTIARNTIQLESELQKEFAEWCVARGRKMSPTASRIVRWFLDQDQLTRDFILVDPETRVALADALERMAGTARAAKVTGVVTLPNSPHRPAEPPPARRARS